MTSLNADQDVGAAFPHRSFWSEAYGPYRPSQPLMGSIKVDVAIVGAGFTGLSAAINLKELDPSLSVAVLEQESVGFGASGRNSGWVWPNVNGYEAILAKHGEKVLGETYAYAKRAYQYVGELVSKHKLDSEYRATGILRPAVHEGYEKDVQEYIDFCRKLGKENLIRKMCASEVQAVCRSPLFGKGVWDEEHALIQPVKHARELARVARELGVCISEQTPVIQIDADERRVLLSTPNGEVHADRIVIATNAYTHTIKGLEAHGVPRLQRPVFAYNTLTRPLTEEEWSDLGWDSRCAIYTFGPGSHFGNPTADGRLHWCSDRFVGVPRDADMGQHWEYVHNYNATLCQQTKLFFPSLKNIHLTHHWGGPVSVTLDQMYYVGAVDPAERVYVSLGCNGNGVATTHLNGKIVAELLTEKSSGLSKLWFVNRKMRKFPGALLSSLGIRLVLGVDRWKADRRAHSLGLQKLVKEVEG